MDRIKTVIQYLETHVDQPLSIEEIARVACLSPVQLYRVFKKMTGLTPIQYHEHLRIRESMRLLQEAERVQDVAYDLGYQNYETFTRAFKKIIQLAPSDLLWGVSFLDQRHQDGSYVLVKKEATLSQVRQLIESEESLKFDPEALQVYRLHPKGRRKPEIRRCSKTEADLRLSLKSP